MKPILFLVGLLAAAALTASAQETKPLPPRTIREAIAVPVTPSASSEANGDRHPQARPANLFFCPPKTCLYYAGDSDYFNPNNNGLFDIDNPGIGITDAEVWVGVRPVKDASVTGTSGNFLTNTSSIGINPTPFAVRTGISSGKGGKLVCRTAGNATISAYGDCNLAECMNYYIPKLRKACRLNRSKVYFVSMQPQYDDGSTIGYLEDDDGRQLNHQGWPNLRDKSYFNSTSFGFNYEPTWGGNGACGGIGCDGFSIALTGKQD